MSDALLALEAIHYRYPQSDWALHDIALQFQPGSFWGIIGPNGSGKSTLLKIAAGILRPASGAVCLGEYPLQKMNRRRIARQLAYLPQAVTPTFDYTVEETVCLGRCPHLSGAGFLGPTDHQVVDQCLQATEVVDLRHRPLSKLSGGQRQRVLLASVLAQQPRILLLDEPTTALDFDHQIAFFTLLQKLTAEGIAVVTVLHDLNLAVRFCRRFALLKDGRLISHGPREQVLTESQLAAVYTHPIEILQPPQMDWPILLPRVTPQAFNEPRPSGSRHLPTRPQSDEMGDTL